MPEVGLGWQVGVWRRGKGLYAVGGGQGILKSVQTATDSLVIQGLQCEGSVLTNTLYDNEEQDSKTDGISCLPLPSPKAVMM